MEKQNTRNQEEFMSSYLSEAFRQLAVAANNIAEELDKKGAGVTEDTDGASEELLVSVAEARRQLKDEFEKSQMVC